MIAQAEATGNQVLLKRSERLLLLLPKLVLTAPVLSPQASQSMLEKVFEEQAQTACVRQHVETSYDVDALPGTQTAVPHAAGF